MNALDETHDGKRRSWVASANGHRDFPIQNLPLGVFTPPPARVMAPGNPAPASGCADEVDTASW